MSAMAEPVHPPLVLDIRPASLSSLPNTGLMVASPPSPVPLSAPVVPRPRLHHHVNILGRPFPPHRAEALSDFATRHNLKSSVWVTEDVVKKQEGCELAASAIPCVFREAIGNQEMRLYSADQTNAQQELESLAFQRAYGTHLTLKGTAFSLRVAAALTLGMNATHQDHTLASDESKQPGPQPTIGNIWVTASQMEALGIKALPGAVPVPVPMRCEVLWNIDQTDDAVLLKTIAELPTPTTLSRGPHPHWLRLAAHIVLSELKPVNGRKPRDRADWSHVWGTAAEYRRINVPLRRNAETVELFVRSSGQVFEVYNAADSADRAKCEAIAGMHEAHAKTSRLERERKRALQQKKQERSVSDDATTLPTPSPEKSDSTSIAEPTLVQDAVPSASNNRMTVHESTVRV